MGLHCSYKENNVFTWLNLSFFFLSIKSYTSNTHSNTLSISLLLNEIQIHIGLTTLFKDKFVEYGFGINSSQSPPDLFPL